MGESSNAGFDLGKPSATQKGGVILYRVEGHCAERHRPQFWECGTGKHLGDDRGSPAEAALDLVNVPPPPIEISDAAESDVVTDAAFDPSKLLWCVCVRGPDDLVPVASYENAVRLADGLNYWYLSQSLTKHDPWISAVPALWEYEPDAHAKHLAKLGTKGSDYGMPSEEQVEAKRVAAFKRLTIVPPPPARTSDARESDEAFLERMILTPPSTSTAANGRHDPEIVQRGMFPDHIDRNGKGHFIKPSTAAVVADAPKPFRKFLEWTDVDLAHQRANFQQRCNFGDFNAYSLLREVEAEQDARKASHRSEPGNGHQGATPPQGIATSATVICPHCTDGNVGHDTYHVTCPTCRGSRVVPAPAGAGDNAGVMQDDLRQLLDLLGLPSGAQSRSPHAVFQEALAVLRPRIATLQAQLTEQAKAGTRADGLREAATIVQDIFDDWSLRLGWGRERDAARSILAALDAKGDASHD